MSPSVLALPPGGAQDRFKLLRTVRPPEFIPRGSSFQPLPTWIGLRSLHPSVPSPVTVGFARVSLQRSAPGPQPDPHLALWTPSSGAHRGACDLGNLEPLLLLLRAPAVSALALGPFPSQVFSGAGGALTSILQLPHGLNPALSIHIQPFSI